MWFESLTGFSEQSPEQVRALLRLEGETLVSSVNGRRLVCGRLEMPTLAALRQRVNTASGQPGQLRVREVVADVQHLHLDPENAGALFQVASQFNLLEMISPSVTPEEGVSRYEFDRTQGPACAVAAGAGTIYRNYFAPVGDQLGQTADRQLDCLADIGAALGNVNQRLWTMRNGYALPTRAGLEAITERLQGSSAADLDALRGLLRIGLQWNTEVTLQNAGQRVSQAYCSALPVAYAQQPVHLWAPFARLVLEAAYEATLAAAAQNAAEGRSARVFLTLLGGGVFGNALEWILDALRRALTLYRHHALEVILVSYGSSQPAVQALVRDWTPA